MATRAQIKADRVKEARRERRNARDRINYYFKKKGLPIRFSDVANMMPKVSGKMSLSELNQAIKLFKAWTSGRIQEYVQEMQDFIQESLQDFDEEMAPEPFNVREAYSDMLHGLDENIGEYFDSVMEYLDEYSSFTEVEIDELLDDYPGYFDTIRKYYEEYEDDQRGRNTKYWGSRKVINQMMAEIFHVYVNE